MPITLDGTNGITTPTYGGADTSEYLVPVTQFKNRIINGAMQIDQRNAGASVTLTSANSVFAVDRYESYANTDGTVTAQRVTDAPVGFTNSVRHTTTVADSSLSAAQRVQFVQKIEGFNVADFGLGAANAITFTVSFWVKSSLTGTFGGAIVNGGYTRSYPFTYTINSANTWEKKSITIAGDTSGTWLTDNQRGLILAFALGMGSDFIGTVNTWQAGEKLSPSGTVSLVGTLNATWQITGVQLEVGSTATSFDYRPYGTELQLCQRYYEKSYNIDVVAGTNTGIGAVFSGGSASATTTGYISSAVQFRVSKRGTPTVTFYDEAGNSGKCTRVTPGVAASQNQNISSGTIGFNGMGVESTSGDSRSNIQFHYVASSEL